MDHEIFADAVGEITVGGSIVRIDFVSLSATEKDASGLPKPVVRQRVIMPLDGFANATDLMLKALQGLEEAGAIRRTASPASTTAPADPLRPNRSPNFS